MRERRGVRWTAVAVVALAAGLSGPGDGRAEAGKTTVVIGSKNFTENRLLGEIMAQLIEDGTDLQVERRINLGGTTVVFSALREGQIDIYPEYTGTGWSILLGIQERVSDSLRAYLRVKTEFRDKFRIEWLKPFGFSNSYALAMREDVASRLQVNSISDLKTYQDELEVGVSHEFLNRQDGYPGLAEAYDLQFADLRGMEHGLAYEAIRSGRIDLIDTWTTDGKLLRYDVRVLTDDRAFFPPYDAAPTVRMPVLQSHPELGPLLDRLGFRIDNRRMQELNDQVEGQGKSFARVAREFLRAEGLLQTDRGTTREAAAGVRSGGFLAFFWGRRDTTAALALQHLLLTATAVLLAIVVAVPLGIGLTRSERLASPVMAATGVIQTIPSLALLAFMIPMPGLGLGARSAIAALFLYALLPILRNSYTGIKGVDAELIEAARGMGLTGIQTLFRVELPLAVPTIMAGVRTSSVISIGVATLAAFIGAGGLGDPIVTGLQLNDINLILAGAIPAALLAVVVDFVLGKVEKALVPRGLR